MTATTEIDLRDLIGISQVVLRSRFKNDVIGVGDIARVVGECSHLLQLSYGRDERTIENKAIIELAQRMIPTGTIPNA